MSLTVTATEFKTNMGRYLDMLSDNTTILITRNGKLVGKLTNPTVSNVDEITGILAGKLPDSYDRHTLREERVDAYKGID